jgi:plastocyanin
LKIRILLAALVLSAIARMAPSTAAPEGDRIVIDQFMFHPTTLRIRAGATVTWLNEDEEPHTVVSASGLFRSSALDTHDTFSFKFDKPGTYGFVCSIHPQMIGTIVVE